VSDAAGPQQWSAVIESKMVGSGEIMETLNGVRSGMFVEEPETGGVGILRETWWEAVGMYGSGQSNGYRTTL
jgi:hypothetical protein